MHACNSSIPVFIFRYAFSNIHHATWRVFICKEFMSETEALACFAQTAPHACPTAQNILSPPRKIYKNGSTGENTCNVCLPSQRVATPSDDKNDDFELTEDGGNRRIRTRGKQKKQRPPRKPLTPNTAWRLPPLGSGTCISPTKLYKHEHPNDDFELTEDGGNSRTRTRGCKKKTETSQRASHT